MTNIEALIETYNKQRKEFIDTMQNECGNYFKSLVTQFDVEALRWTQYTPYFNDGDPCVFGVHHLEVQFKGEEDFLNVYSTDNKKQKKTIETIEKIRNMIPNEVMLAVFGDHMEVTITRDAVTTEEYDHD